MFFLTNSIRIIAKTWTCKIIMTFLKRFLLLFLYTIQHIWRPRQLILDRFLLCAKNILSCYFQRKWNEYTCATKIAWTLGTELEDKKISLTIFIEHFIDSIQKKIAENSFLMSELKFYDLQFQTQLFSWALEPCHAEQIRFKNFGGAWSKKKFRDFRLKSVCTQEFKTGFNNFRIRILDSKPFGIRENWI